MILVKIMKWRLEMINFDEIKIFLNLAQFSTFCGFYSFFECDTKMVIFVKLTFFKICMETQRNL